MSDRVPFNDLAIQWAMIAPAVRRDFEDIFATSAFCLGSHVEAFEAEVAAWLGVRHAIGVNSGTSALHLAMIVNSIGPGVEVLLPTHTFIATAWGVVYAGGTPVLVDVDDVTGTIDLEDAARKITPATRAIIPVHLYGQPAEMDKVMAFAQEHALAVIEDAAQAMGASWNGSKVSGLGQCGCLSFYPGKNLGAAGEAGLVVTNDDVMAERLRSLRNHGQSQRYIHEEVGFNYRLDGLQAAVLRNKLPHLDAWTAERRVLAANYSEALDHLPVRLPIVAHQNHVWHNYVLRTPLRDELRAHLAGLAIDTGLHYPVPLHRQPCFSGFPGMSGQFPVAEQWAAECISLPIFPGMTADQQGRVIDGVRAFFEVSRSRPSRAAAVET